MGLCQSLLFKKKKQHLLQSYEEEYINGFKKYSSEWEFPVESSTNQPIEKYNIYNKTSQLPELKEEYFNDYSSIEDNIILNNNSKT